MQYCFLSGHDGGSYSTHEIATRDFWYVIVHIGWWRWGTGHFYDIGDQRLWNFRIGLGQHKPDTFKRSHNFYHWRACICIILATLQSKCDEFFYTFSRIRTQSTINYGENFPRLICTINLLLTIHIFKRDTSVSTRHCLFIQDYVRYLD